MKKYRVSIIIFVVVIIFLLVSLIVGRVKQNKPSDYIYDDINEVSDTEDYYEEGKSLDDTGYTEDEDFTEVSNDEDSQGSSSIDIEESANEDILEVEEKPIPADTSEEEPIPADTSEEEPIPADIPEEEVTKIDNTNFEYTIVAFVTDRLDDETRTLISDKLLGMKDKVLKDEPYNSLRGVADFQSWSGDFDKGYVNVVTMDGGSYRFSFKLDSVGKLSKVEYQD